jgi:hypothetical protein
MTFSPRVPGRLRPRLALVLAFALGAPCAVLALAGTARAGDEPDLDAVHRIKQEAFKHSQVMQHLFRMTDVYGPRLTNSPGYDAAAAWIVEAAREWGLENVALEPWEPFGRGWSTTRFSAHLVEPRYSPLIGVPLVWSPSTDGVVSGTPILTPLATRERFEDTVAEVERYMAEWEGKLAGKIILLREARHLSPQENAPSKRLDANALNKRALAPDLFEPLEIDFADPRLPDGDYEQKRFWATAPGPVRERLWKRRRKLTDRFYGYLSEQGAALVIHPAWNGDGGTVFPPRGGSYEAGAPLPPPSIALTPEHYNRLVRLVERGPAPRVEVEVRARIHDEDLTADNVVAEIPGRGKADELVMLGAHLDDVHYGQGATDNAAGCAVMLEAMRVLRKLDLPMERTVRMVLWSGEEQGLLGSRAYVKRHFGDPATMELLPEHAKVSGYFNFDNGTGKIRGVYLQENDMVRPIFASWLKPFHDYGAKTLTLRNTGGTDHLSFDAVGLPGFQFIQDPVEYSSRTHHSNMDTYDHVQPGDLMQAAAIVATFVYHAANRDELLPRKPLPEPWPDELRDAADANDDDAD